MVENITLYKHYCISYFLGISFVVSIRPLYIPCISDDSTLNKIHAFTIGKIIRNIQMELSSF